MWKPGQCVTIRHRRYRIRKSEKHTCEQCAFERESADVFPCNECCEGTIVPYGCIFQHIYIFHNWKRCIEEYLCTP